MPLADSSMAVCSICSSDSALQGPAMMKGEPVPVLAFNIALNFTFVDFFSEEAILVFALQSYYYLSIMSIAQNRYSPAATTYLTPEGAFLVKISLNN